MKRLTLVLSILLALLSMAAGGAKVALVPQEVQFLSQFGLGESAVAIFGGLQVLGGLALLIPATRFIGALLVMSGFAVSTVLLTMDGNIPFAVVSLLPVLLVGLIVHQSRPNPNNAARD